MRSPHRHSVWIDVFGVVLVGAVLLGGVVLLIGTGSSHFGLSEATPGHSAGGSAIANGASARGPAPTASRGPTIGASRVPPGLSNPLSGGGGGASAPAPFSDGWREQAVPDLTGPSVGAPAAPVGGSKVAGQEQGESSGPVLASRRSSRGSGASAAGRGSGGAAGRRAEAERFADQATALAGQLRQMSEPSGSEEEAAPSAEEAQTSSVGSRAKASGPGTPDDPNQVPIGDHLPWLAVVGVLWGAWRIGRGA
jgi:hypothetical protein